MLLWHAKVVLLKSRAWHVYWHGWPAVSGMPLQFCAAFLSSVVGLRVNTLLKTLRDDENPNQFVYNSGSSASKITQQDHNASKQTYKSTLKSGTPERCERSSTYWYHQPYNSSTAGILIHALHGRPIRSYAAMPVQRKLGGAGRYKNPAPAKYANVQ